MRRGLVARGDEEKAVWAFRPLPWMLRASTSGPGAWRKACRRLARSESGDKDPVDRPPVRWPWDGVKGRLCGTTISGGYKSGVTEPGTWQAVLKASNAVEAGKSWTLLGSRLRSAERNPGGWPD